MIDRNIVETVDYLLDKNTGQDYKEQPLAQDWARVSKRMEEKGESIAELILATGQNPRKPKEMAAYKRLLDELADEALSPLYAIQHFTKDIDHTERVLAAAQERHITRLIQADKDINL